MYLKSKKTFQIENMNKYNNTVFDPKSEQCAFSCTFT